MSDAQKRIALEIVDDLERQFQDLTWTCCSWDSDAAAETIAMLIPETAAEQEAEFQRMMADIPDECGPPRPSRFAALREAVHAIDGMSITCVIEAATQEIERLRLLWQTAVDNEGTQWAEDITAAAAAGGGDG